MHPMTRASGGVAPATIVGLAIIAALALWYGAFETWRAFLPLEINVNEVWNAFHATALRAGQPLYPDPSGLVINNYPPLSFYLLAGASALGLDPLYTGRILSVIAVVAIGGAVASLIRLFRGSAVAALMGGLWFAATMTCCWSRYVGMNDPHLAAMALMSWALVWLVHRQIHGRTSDPAILLMVVAGFYKHSLLAMPLTAVAWLALTDRRAAIRATLVGLGAAVIGLLACVFAYGPVFIQSLLMPRVYTLHRSLIALGDLHWIAPALLVGAIWLWQRRGDAAARFCFLFAAIAFVVQFVERSGAGVDDDGLFELVVAAAVGLGFTFGDTAALPRLFRLNADGWRIVILVVVIARLLLPPTMGSYLLLADRDFRSRVLAQADVARSEIARIAAIPGPVICSVRMVCWRAGKGFTFDNFFLLQSLATGRRSSSDIERQVQALGVRHEEVDPRTAWH